MFANSVMRSILPYLWANTNSSIKHFCISLYFLEIFFLASSKFSLGGSSWAIRFNFWMTSAALSRLPWFMSNNSHMYWDCARLVVELLFEGLILFDRNALKASISFWASAALDRGVFRDSSWSPIWMTLVATVFIRSSSNWKILVAVWNKIRKKHIYVHLLCSHTGLFSFNFNPLSHCSVLNARIHLGHDTSMAEIEKCIPLISALQIFTRVLFNFF